MSCECPLIWVRYEADTRGGHCQGFVTSLVFFYVPLSQIMWRVVSETGPTVYRPYPRRLECLTICRCHDKGSTFSSVILRPWVLVRPRFELTTSRSAGRRSTNWANRAAVTELTGRRFHVWFQCLPCLDKFYYWIQLE